MLHREMDLKFEGVEALLDLGMREMKVELKVERMEVEVLESSITCQISWPRNVSACLIKFCCKFV